ncbi:MAG: SUMF1/EgtB/PvdO family nonheme iron enzyme [Planctomycetota bacterium]
MTFTDHVPYPNERVPFKMVRVPGSADGSIKPFFIGQTEVTWAMFRGWSYGIDLQSTSEVKHELDQGLRPSELYADRPNAQMGFGKRPAIGMTRENAEVFCSWLSKKTGRTYRLPTDAEWSHVLRLSGGIPDQEEQLLDQAVLFENAMLDQLGNSLTFDVASKAPNRLGLHDLLGNAAEWVQSEGGASWVRGGHFQLETDQLSADWRATEDREVWNASSPKLPSDTWWYVDHYYQGFRLVCEEASENEEAPASPNVFHVGPTPDGLPESFTDHVTTYENKEVPFEMVLIPGDEANNIKPFYVAKTEVTWEMFLYWAYAGDVEDINDINELQKLGLRPSGLAHGHPQTDLQMVTNPKWPATGMSWRVAQAYCRWVSEQTGRTYRLPTDNEWMHLLEKSGGIPNDHLILKDRALLLDNNTYMDEPPFLFMPRAVARGEPDALGLYDLLGNAAEWVQPMGGKRWVRGGHFMTKAKEMSRDWLAFEDQKVWNASYPQLPVSDSWYVDQYFQGIRLVCSIDVGRPEPPKHDKYDASRYPDSFTDKVLGYQEKQVPFEMVLIAGDEAKGIDPFYIGKTEVSREMFLRWAYGGDLQDGDFNEYHKLIEKDLRPSPIYSEHTALHVARMEEDWLAYPALGMSWRTAQAYCIWLSEQTGKTYRLPTDDEWMHVLELSGGVPSDPKQLLDQAVLEDNAAYDIFGFHLPRKSDEGVPNRLGLLNLLGNATEWVEPTKEERWVRGGHFALKAEELTDDWRATEDQAVWNEHYPGIPPSRHWYLDFYFTGLRLVCEVESVEPE